MGEKDENQARDEATKELLLSSCQSEVEEGLRRLDEHYRDYVPNWVRTLRVCPEEVWQDVLLSINGQVQAGNFKREGSLKGYVAMITRCRAADHLCRYLRVETCIGDCADLEFAEQASFDNYIQLLKDIRCFYIQQSEEDQVYLRVLRRIYIGISNGAPRKLRLGTITAPELTEMVNRANGHKNLTIHQVKYQLANIRANLRVFLKGRGHHV